MASYTAGNLRQKIANLYHWGVSWGYAIVYGLPARKLKVIGVTGTDGKTTTCHLLYEMLKQAGISVALISTVGAFIKGEEIDTGFHVTTPDAKFLQPLLKKMVNRGVSYVILEVTSHGLDQNRLVGIGFYIGVITNVSHEHLDYHGTISKYRQAKAKLIQKAQFAVLNFADSSFDFFKSQTRGEVVAYAKTKTSFANPVLRGEYNKFNVAAAQAAADILKVDSKFQLAALKNFAGVPGRMEEVNLGQKFRAIVDFAHTPNALQNVLTELKSQLKKEKRLIVVFGCAGLRDHTKRPLMGQIAKKLADIVIVTAEDPRTESLDDIYAQITHNQSGFKREDDRQKAINLAVKSAKPGDIVVACGKGHERSMCFGHTEVPWSDRDALQAAISHLK